jgi:molybdopterin/thiamine biosynthesis adenylyltransferase/rhodanese-related sulfurtransferase
VARPARARASTTSQRSPDLARYGRHLLLPEVGAAGQRRLLDGRVLIVGAGGLGAPAALYLTAAGVGHIGLVDFDRVELTNLQRQVIYQTSDVGRSKGTAARKRLRALNPDIEVVAYDERLERANARRILRRYDVVIDASDNFATRYLVSDACVLLGKPDVFASVYRFEGQATVFDGRVGPCYRCLFPEPPPPGSVPSCAEAGVLGAVPGLLGLIQATEAIKLLLGIGETLVGRLMLVDLLSMRTRELALRKSSSCPICGPHPTQHDLVDYAALCGDAPGPPDPGVPIVTPGELANELAGPSPPILVDVRSAAEWALGHLPAARHIPLDTLSGRLSELPPSAAVVTYCQSGRRSAAAVGVLRGRGHANVRSLAGGLTAWEARPAAPPPRRRRSRTL